MYVYTLNLLGGKTTEYWLFLPFFPLVLGFSSSMTRGYFRLWLTLLNLTRWNEQLFHFSRRWRMDDIVFFRLWCQHSRLMQRKFILVFLPTVRINFNLSAFKDSSTGLMSCSSFDSLFSLFQNIPQT